jgi:hypothetical protein
MNILVAIALAVVSTLAVPMPSQADEGDLQVLHDSCLTSLNVPPGVCECIAETAASDLNDKQQAMVAAMVSGDQAQSAVLRGELTIEEITAAAGFMTNAPAACAAQ